MVLQPRIGIVGATGAVGRTLIQILEETRLPFASLVLFASERSRGKTLSVHGQSYHCEVLGDPNTVELFKKIDVLFFDASDAVSKQWVPLALQAGCTVVDNSAVFRGDPAIPLVVPEINGHLLKTCPSLVSGPNCTTVQLAMALKPLQDAFGIRRVFVSTYQSVSGAGERALAELKASAAKPELYSVPLAGNCIPRIGTLRPSGYTSEEEKIMTETRKILDLPDLAIAAHAVRVPVPVGHSEAVQIELQKSAPLTEIYRALKAFPGLEVMDSTSDLQLPMPHLAQGQNTVQVGRIHQDLSIPNGLFLWICSDNLRKGAAWNAYQIGKVLFESCTK